MFSRVGTHGKPFKETDMNVTLNHVINMLSQSINETAAKITSDPLPVIFADESQMIQILQNLISNAIKFHGGQDLHLLNALRVLYPQHKTSLVTCLNV